MSHGGYPSGQEWLRGWREWARTRKRGRMAQFIVEKLEEGNQARWLDITKGVFELTEWHAIAKEWFGEKPRNSEQVDAPCMLRKGLPRAFPGLDELKDQSRKEGTQYRSRVFQAPPQLVQEVILHITNRPPGSHHNYPAPPQQHESVSYAGGYSNGGLSNTYYTGASMQQLPYNGTHSHSPAVKLETATPMQSMDYPDPASEGFMNSSSLDVAAQVIASSGMMDHTQFTSSATSSSNGWYGGRLAVPTSPGSAGVFSEGELGGSLMGSPAPPYSVSPSASPSYSQPNSVPDHHLAQPVSAELSPATHASGSPAMISSNPVPTRDEPDPSFELFSVKAVPNNSTLEGGGTLALVFYQQLPVGNKLVTFASRANPTLMLTQQAFVENALVLTTSIPKYPHPEEVDVRVFTAEGILLASTPFTYYDLNNSDLMLHILSQQLQSYFPAGTPGAGGMQGTAGVDGANGYVGGGGGYHVPNAVYQLLLGACRLGCEPLVACLLNLPAMKSITVNELQKACDIADGCGHTQLSAILLQMVTMHNMPYEQVLVSRGAGNEDDSSRASPQLHVDEYYTAMGKLARGGSSPREQAATVMSQLLKAIQVNKKEKEEKEKDAEQPPSVDQLASDMEKATISTAAQRRHSYLHHQPRSISDEDNDDGSSTVATVGDDDAARQGSRPSLSEQGDTVGPLPYDDHDRFSLHKGKFAQMSDADSAIGMSFEDDSQSLLLSEVQRRKSSSIVPADFVSASRDSNDMAITVKLPPDAGIEVSNTLNWKTAFFVSEDYPASSEHKIFYRGDQIIQVGGKAVSGLSREEFSELFDESLSAGTSVKILPQVDRMTEGKDGKMLRRMPSDHAIFDSITRRVNNLLTTKSSSTPRNVSIPHTSSGFGVKMIGGKSVGVFISDVRPDLSSVSPGDQVLEINGHRTQGLTLYQATQLLRMNTSDLNLSVVENKAKFQAVREQFELDSFYVRSRVDMPATSMRDMSLKKGLLLHVVNTVIYAPNYWLAWAVNEQTGMETHLRRIPSPAMAKRQFKSDIYDDVVRNTALFPRPVCLIGPDSQRVAAALATNKLFTNCSTLDEALRVFAKGTQHAVISTSDPAVVENMSAIHPIVLQTQAEEGASLMEQIKFSKFRVSALLSGGSTTEVAGQVIKKTNEQQHLPVWTTAGVLS